MLGIVICHRSGRHRREATLAGLAFALEWMWWVFNVVMLAGVVGMVAAGYRLFTGVSHQLRRGNLRHHAVHPIL